jgi:hypothetical protein
MSGLIGSGRKTCGNAFWSARASKVEPYSEPSASRIAAMPAS